MKNDDNVRKSDLWTKNKNFIIGFILVILSIALGGIVMTGIIFDEIDDICRTENKQILSEKDIHAQAICLQLIYDYSTGTSMDYIKYEESCDIIMS